jgi:hypothetical protein
MYEQEGLSLSIVCEGAHDQALGSFKRLSSRANYRENDLVTFFMLRTMNEDTLKELGVTPRKSIAYEKFTPRLNVALFECFVTHDSTKEQVKAFLDMCDAEKEKGVQFAKHVHKHPTISNMHLILNDGDLNLDFVPKTPKDFLETEWECICICGKCYTPETTNKEESEIANQDLCVDEELPEDEESSESDDEFTLE